jgi:hypothetical protein
MFDVRKSALAIALSAVLGAAVTAQDAPARKQPSAGDPDMGSTPKEFKALKYRLIGPAAGGRVSRVAGIAGDPATYYAATASGGVW